MLLGREKELLMLEQLYQEDGFQFLILYGRRRVGKTKLLREFARKHPVIFFSAQEKNDALNLKDFSVSVRKALGYQAELIFNDWETAFAFLDDHQSDQKMVLIMDEFPYIAEDNPSVKSVLQHAIDHRFQQRNFLLILCGSSVSFMEKEVLSAHSPLYGRATAQYEMKPFDYLDSARFFPEWTPENRLLAYGILGGIPAYLAAFSASRSIEENLAENVLRESSFLRNETQNLLKMELREPSVYNSILEAVASGSSRLNDIAGKIHEEQSKCSRYISTLRGMRLMEKKIPCGEKEDSKKTIYQISDPFFSFWYYFLFRNQSYFYLLGEEDAAREIMDSLSGYMGPVFEKVCMEYMIRRAKSRTLPFVPAQIGRWWGNNPQKKKQDDIDILALDRSGKKAICCECKFRNQHFDEKELRNLLEASEIRKEPVEKYYFLFSKSGFTTTVEKEAARLNIELITPDQMFSD